MLMGLFPTLLVWLIDVPVTNEPKLDCCCHIDVVVDESLLAKFWMR